MRHLILTTTAPSSRGTAGSATAARPQVTIPKRAASGMAQPRIDRPRGRRAAGL